MTNSIRPCASASLLVNGEALPRRRRCEGGRPVALRGSVGKRRRWGHRVVGDGMVPKAVHVKQGDLCDGESRTGVRAPIVALTRGNARRAKGCRKVDA